MDGRPPVDGRAPTDTRDGETRGTGDRRLGGGTRAESRAVRAESRALAEAAAEDEDFDDDDDVYIARVRPLLAVTIALFSLLLAFGLVIGSRATLSGFSIVVFGVQVLFVLAWTVASRPPAPWVVGGVGVLAAAGATIAVNLPVEASLAPLAYVVAGAFAVGVVGQLIRRTGRLAVTESLAATMIIVVGVTSLAGLIVLWRRPNGTQILLAGLAAAGIAVAVARLCDIIAPVPRLALQVPRGGAGVVAGAMAGTVAGAVVGAAVQGLVPLTGAFAGMVAALVAVVVDLGTGYAEAGRRLEGEPPGMWIARHMQGPLGAFAFSAPASYVVGVVLS